MTPEIIKAIDALAKEQNRNRSNTVEWVLFEWFRQFRPDLFQPVVKEVIEQVFSESLEESIESVSLLVNMPAEEVADAVDDFVRDEKSQADKKQKPEK